MKLQKAGEPTGNCLFGAAHSKASCDSRLSTPVRKPKNRERQSCPSTASAGQGILSIWDINNKLAMVKKYYYRTEFERKFRTNWTMMQRWHENKGWETPMPGWMFNRKTKELSPKVKDAVIQSLKLQERLEVTTSQTQGRSALSYRLSN